MTTKPQIQLYHADALKFVQCLQDHLGITSIVSSPPYKRKDGFVLDDMTLMFDALRHHCIPGALMFINFGHLVGYKADPFELAMRIEQVGWNWHDTIAWIKHWPVTGEGHFTPLSGHNLNNLWEPIFLFSNGKAKLDRLAIGVPYKVKSNIKRFSNRGDLRCAGNVWFVPYDTVQSHSEKRHHHEFPIEIPRRCIKLSTVKTGLIYDPYSGSGTTGFAAAELGYNYAGTERDRGIINRSLRNFQKAGHQVEKYGNKYNREAYSFSLTD